jgi:hypothetical protein
MILGNEQRIGNTAHNLQSKFRRVQLQQPM